MNIHDLYKKERDDLAKVKHNNGGGRGEFYGGDQIYTTDFNKKIVPFTGTGYKLNSDDLPTSKPKNGCCQLVYRYICHFLGWNDNTDIHNCFKGTVIRGKGFGKSVLGIPTANLDTLLDIDDGVYYGYATLSNIRYKMVMSTGIPPNFPDKRTVEVHLINLPESIEEFYGEELSVETIGFIRKMEKYVFST